MTSVQDNPDKGKRGGSCNMTRCQKPNSAWWWNRGSYAWYCESCAHLLNSRNPEKMSDGQAMCIHVPSTATDAEIKAGYAEVSVMTFGLVDGGKAKFSQIYHRINSKEQDAEEAERRKEMCALCDLCEKGIP